ncbi:MAG TPA: DUF349 domain-containing protein [Vicinamibacterales bacterium]|jgi:hypothetical protein
MTLLDRFRTQQPQKHPDAAVRLAYLEELPLTDRDAIAAMAREDEDPRVRKAAAAKLMDPVALAAIIRDDADESVRAQALGMLRDIAVEAFEGVGEAESLEAVEAIADPRALAHVAKTAVREITALRALSRIDDVRLLGSVARHAVVEPVRRGAFESLRERGEHAELAAVAINSDFKDTALAAVELVTDRAELEQIAVRARNKASARRARAMVRELDAAEGLVSEPAVPDPLDATATPPHGDPLVPALEPPPVEESVVVHAAEAAPAPAAVVAPPVFDPQAEHDQAARREREEREAAERREDDAQDAAAREASQAADRERRHARLAELVVEAAASAAETDLAAARKRFAPVRKEWTDLAAAGDVDAEQAAQFAAHEQQIGARDAEARETDARARREALGRLHNLLGRVEPLLPKPDLSLKAAERALRDVRTALSSMPMLPTKQDYEDCLHRLKAAQTALTPRVQELREADDWRRFANVGVQEQLCARMEALQTEPDPEKIAHSVRELQEQWRASADVPRAQADALWRRFKTAHDLVWPRVEAHFASQAQERGENLTKKIALCEQAEALADSTNWIQTAEAIKALQAEWKTIGPVSRGKEKAIWDRFRAACDRFFTRRHEDLAQRKATWTANYAKKEELAIRAEALAQSTEWDAAAAEIKRLQAEWRTVGPVKKSRSEAIWQRFRGACDAFFARYAQRHDTARAERVAAREALCAELEALADQESATDESGAARPPDDLLARVRTIRNRWQQEIASRGVDPDRARALDDRFAAALQRTTTKWPAPFGGSELDPEANRKRLESLVSRMETLATSISGPQAAAANDESVSPTTRLAAMLKEALAANTIGGKVDDDSRMRAAAEEVRQAQAQWSRIGQVPEDARRQLSDRFQKAIRRITERTSRSSAPRSTVRRGSPV